LAANLPALNQNGIFWWA